MGISARITGVKYKTFLARELKKIDINDFDVNSRVSCCLVNDKSGPFAISKWTSPKRSRTYPFERIYNTYMYQNKITVIPVIKDEGGAGERDYITWDTIALMSLLDIYVILGYYIGASKHKKKKGKITKQLLDNDYIHMKIKQIRDYHSSALHWNLNEVQRNLSIVVDRAISNYLRIGKQLKVNLHGAKGLSGFKAEITAGLKRFMDSSRARAKRAQHSESTTVQPKELLGTSTKTKITITNFLGGIYFWTVDEILLEEKTAFLIESKHSRKNKVPSLGDIRDGLFKMILYSNLSDVRVDGVRYKYVPVVKLTSTRIQGVITSDSADSRLTTFFAVNKFKKKQSDIISKLLEEAKHNKFKVVVQGV